YSSVPGSGSQGSQENRRNSCHIIFIFRGIFSGIDNFAGNFVKPYSLFAPDTGGDLSDGICISENLSFGISGSLPLLLFHGSAAQLWEYTFSGNCHVDLHGLKCHFGSVVYPLDGIFRSRGRYLAFPDTLSYFYVILSVEEKIIFHFACCI